MVTRKDVARACGVSEATVSQVLGNGKRPVHEETRRRVLETARSLNYQPNALARALAGKRMNAIGVVFTRWSSPQNHQFQLELLAGILTVTGDNRQNVTLFALDSWASISHQLPEMSDGRCDGILLMLPPLGCPLPELLLARQVPCASIGSMGVEDSVAPCVDVDNRGAAFATTKALMEMGHQRIAFVRPGYNTSDVLQILERRAGYREAMEAAGRGRDALDITWEEAVALAPLAVSQRPTAFFCSHDQEALTLMDRIALDGVRVPDDVSVVGFDDIPAASVYRPALSTVRQPMRKIGERAAQRLLARIEGTEKDNACEVLPTELVLRESTSRLT